MLYPMHVVLLELVIDPVCSLVFEAEPSEINAINKPPRPRNQSLFGSKELFAGLFQGAVILAAVFGLYIWRLSIDVPAGEARALAFTALVVGNLILAFAEAAEVGRPSLILGEQFFGPLGAPPLWLSS